MKKYCWIEDDRIYKMFSDTPPTPNAKEINDDLSPIDFSYYPYAYEDDGEAIERNLKLVEELDLPKHRVITINFLVDGNPYYLPIKNLDNRFYKGVVISNDRQDIDPGDLCCLKEEYVKLICDKIKEGLLCLYK